MTNVTIARLTEVRSTLSSIVLIVEDGDANLPLEAVEELRKIEGYLDRISARVEPGRGGQIGGVA